MRYVLLLSCLLLPAPKYTHAQQLQGKQRIDSLQQQLNIVRDSMVKASLLLHLSFEYRTTDPEKGIRYADQAMQLSNKISWKKGVAIANNNKGLNYKFMSDYPNALTYTLIGLELNEKLGDKPAIATSLSYLGVIYQQQANYDKALEYLLRSLKINEEQKGNEINMGGDLANIGILYNVYKKDYPKALEYDFKSLAIFTKLKDKDGIGHELGNIGAVYLEMGDFKKSIDYDEKALDVFVQLGDSSSIAINLGNIGETYLGMAKADNATEPDNLKLAISYLAQSIAISKSVSDLESVIEFSQNLSEAYRLAGNYSLALEHYKEFAALRDSVNSTDSKLKITNLETHRALELKDKQIQLDKLEVEKRYNERILLIIVTILLLVIISIGLKEYLAQRKWNKQLTGEKKKHLAHIQAQTSVLSEIAYTQSHEVSGQVATILGLVNVLNLSNPADPDNKVAIEGIADVAHKLDVIVKDMIIKENNLNRAGQ